VTHTTASPSRGGRVRFRHRQRADAGRSVLSEPNLRMTTASGLPRQVSGRQHDMEFRAGPGRLTVGRDAPTWSSPDGLVLERVGLERRDTVLYSPTAMPISLPGGLPRRAGELGRLECWPKDRGRRRSRWPAVDVEDASGCHARRTRSATVRPTGRVVGSFPVPVLQPTSCAFGRDGRLFHHLPRNGLSAEELARSPLSGSVFAVETGRRGSPSARSGPDRTRPGH